MAANRRPLDPGHGVRTDARSVSLLRHRSALTDCGKLIRSGLPGRKAIVIFGYDYDDWPMDPAIETLASQRVILGDQHAATYDHLVHPVHQRGRVFAWEIGEQNGCGLASRYMSTGPAKRGP